MSVILGGGELARAVDSLADQIGAAMEIGRAHV